MINKEKVRIMTKLASYEKNIGKEDFTVNGFFKTNYISYNNFKTRLGVTLALLIIFAGDFVVNLSSNINKITEFDFVKAGLKYLIIWLVMMVLYTIISTHIYRTRYNNAQTRINKYKELLNKLDNYK